VIDAFSSPQLLKNLVILIPQLRRDKNLNRLPECFLFCVSENSLRTRVPAGNDRVQILGDDRIFRRLDNAGEPEP